MTPRLRRPRPPAAGGGGGGGGAPPPQGGEGVLAEGERCASSPIEALGGEFSARGGEVGNLGGAAEHRGHPDLLDFLAICIQRTSAGQRRQRKGRRGAEHARLIRRDGDARRCG